MESFNHAHGATLVAYKVNYLCGLPEKNKIITSIQMHLTDNGFLFKKAGFDLYIEYSKVQQIELVKGSGSFWSTSPLVDNIRAKLFEITYFNNCNQSISVRFEMNVSLSPTKNYTACEELLRFMKNNGILDKFVPADPSQSVPSADILAQIEKLAELHQSGALTDEEFQSKKAELLDRL